MNLHLFDTLQGYQTELSIYLTDILHRITGFDRLGHFQFLLTQNTTIHRAGSVLRLSEGFINLYSEFSSPHSWFSGEVLYIKAIFVLRIQNTPLCPSISLVDGILAVWNLKFYSKTHKVKFYFKTHKVSSILKFAKKLYSHPPQTHATQKPLVLVLNVRQLTALRKTLLKRWRWGESYHLWRWSHGAWRGKKR